MSADPADAPQTVQVALAQRGYPVVVGDGLLDHLGDHLDGSRAAAVARSSDERPERRPDHLALPADATRALVVTQQAVVDAEHIAPVERALGDAGLECHRHLVPDGESAKSVEVLAELWRACAQAALSRSDVLVAIGGGVVGDLTGFAAASYNRGIAVLQVPTTLLAQVDSAIGGKTGINLPEGKNLVGAFHQPLGVVCDVGVLRTLPRRILVEGLGEVVKCGLIADPAILDLLEADAAAAVAGDPQLLRELVRRSVAVKAAVVAADEREGGVRAHLNFGHTYAHALEVLTGYGEVLHGEAVAIGTVVALRLGERLGRTPTAVADRGEALLAELGLPIRGPRLDRTAVWEVMRRDKKAGGGDVRFVLLDGLARPVVTTPDPADVDAVLDRLV